VADELAVAHDQLDAFAVEQGHAVAEQGDAVGGVGIAAAVVEQLPAQRHVDVARTGGDEQDVDLALTEILLRAVQVQAQLALRGQQRHLQLSYQQVVVVHFAKNSLESAFRLRRISPHR